MRARREPPVRISVLRKPVVISGIVAGFERARTLAQKEREYVELAALIGLDRAESCLHDIRENKRYLAKLELERRRDFEQSDLLELIAALNDECVRQQKRITVLERRLDALART